MGYIKVATGFNRLKDSELKAKAVEILQAMRGNAAYPDPPVAMTALEAAIEAFASALAAQADGGPPTTAIKKTKREALVEMLVYLGSYVQTQCGGDLSVLLSSAFKPVVRTPPGGPLAKPGSVTLKNERAGVLTATCKAVRRACAYELRWTRTEPLSTERTPAERTPAERTPADESPADASATGASPAVWATQVSTHARNIWITDLAPGATYKVQVRAIGGSTRYSDWSDPTSHMCM